MTAQIIVKADNYCTNCSFIVQSYTKKVFRHQKFVESFKSLIYLIK